MTGISEAEARPSSVQSQDAMGAASEPVGNPAQTGKSPGSDARDQGADAGEAVVSLAAEARDSIADKIEPVKRSARNFAEDQKSSGARKLGDVARVVHVAATQLQPELPQAAKSIHDAAGALEQASTALRERSVDELVNSCLNFARGQPVAFFGIATLTGFAVARFVKSSSRAGSDV